MEAMREKLADGDGRVGGDGGQNEAERLRELQLTVAASSSAFPGFRFSPSDEELISYYLKKKLQGCDDSVDIIPEVDFCRHEPWDLPENEWFFFSTRGKKYPNGSQSKRATQYGYWKATGKERNVKSGDVVIGTKRTLVFHMGRAPKGERTEWIMHEYCKSDTSQESVVVRRLRRNGDFRLTESSRGSFEPKNLSCVDSGKFAWNQTQVDGFDDGNARKSSSKESTSSYKSHSAEQNESECETDQQIHDSAPASSSPYKDEDDCFADIMNDDIIKLDESTSHSLTYVGVLAKDLETICIPQETISAQGTSVRRIKLRRRDKNRSVDHGQQNNPSEKESSCVDHGQRNNSSEKKSSGCVLSVMAGNSRTVSKLTRVILVFLFLMILVVVWQGDYLNSKQHPLQEASKALAS